METGSWTTPEERERLRQSAREARARVARTIAQSTALMETAAVVADAAELRIALSLETRRVLRASVGNYVALLRRLDTPPERVVMDTKEIVADVVPLRDRRAQVVTSLLVGWAIESYYAA